MDKSRERDEQGTFCGKFATSNAHWALALRMREIPGTRKHEGALSNVVRPTRRKQRELRPVGEARFVSNSKSCCAVGIIHPRQAAPRALLFPRWAAGRWIVRRDFSPSGQEEAHAPRGSGINPRFAFFSG